MVNNKLAFPAVVQRTPLEREARLKGGALIINLTKTSD